MKPAVMLSSKKPVKELLESGDRPYHTLLDVICEQWTLESASDCLPHILRPNGEASTWAPDLVHHLAQLAYTTRNERTDAVRELLQTWKMRLRQFPESNSDLCATDVEFVIRRMELAHRALRDKRTQEECDLK